MSFVNAVYSDDFISIISDGKISEPGVERKDEIKKFIIHQNHFFVSVTGYLDIWILIRDFIIQNNALTVITAIEAVHNQLDYLKTHNAENGKIISASAIIAGYDMGKFKGVSLRMVGGELHMKRLCTFGTTSLDPELDFDTAAEISSNLSALLNPNNINMVKKYQRKELRRVAKVSQTVDTKIFQEVIYNE